MYRHIDKNEKKSGNLLVGAEDNIFEIDIALKRNGEIKSDIIKK